MEGNRDAAAQCLTRARQALSARDFAKAQRMAEKSQRLFATAEVNSLMAEISSARKTPGPATPSAPSSRPAPTRRTTPSSSSTASTSSPSPSAPAPAATTRPFTAKQRQRVIQVLRAGSLYETLGVGQDADAAVVKKAYRKLALEFHPDKNSAPKADEAFKKISKAFQVLSNAQSRRQYDVTGDADSNNASGGGGGGGGFQHMSPEEQFAAFFSQMGGVQFHHRTRRGGARQNRQQTEGRSNPFQWIQMLFMFLAIFVFPSFLDSSPSADFVLTAHKNYPVRRALSGLADIHYYVTKPMDVRLRDDHSKSTLKQLEGLVEREWRTTMYTMCRRATEQQKQYQRWGQAQKAARVDTRPCDRYEKYRRDLSPQED